MCTFKIDSFISCAYAMVENHSGWMREERMLGRNFSHLSLIDPNRPDFWPRASCFRNVLFSTKPSHMHPVTGARAYVFKKVPIRNKINWVYTNRH